MARPNRSNEIRHALLEAVATHPRDLVGMVAAQVGLSRARVGTEVRALVSEDYLHKEGTTRPVYSLGRNRYLLRHYPREGLAEDVVWSNDLAPKLRELPTNIRDIAHHGVTEMVNNAVDHSGAQSIIVQMDLRDDILRFDIFDNGVGIFRKIAAALNLPDDRLALLELSKGKFTTDPANHTGEGVFFTSRVFDHFRILSGGLAFDHDDGREDDVLLGISAAKGLGTLVHMTLDTTSTRTLREVFTAYSSGPDDYAFAKTVVPVRLTQIGDENLISRSQAKRLLLRVDKFRHVVLDFEHVKTVGQAFADEIFRVFALAHPEVELEAMHAVPEVQQMIRRAENVRDEQDHAQLRLI